MKQTATSVSYPTSQYEFNKQNVKILSLISKFHFLMFSKLSKVIELRCFIVYTYIQSSLMLDYHMSLLTLSLLHKIRIFASNFYVCYVCGSSKKCCHWRTVQLVLFPTVPWMMSSFTLLLFLRHSPFSSCATLHDSRNFHPLYKTSLTCKVCNSLFSKVI